MGRKREVTEAQAKTLSELGHIIHYSYDPSEMPNTRRAPLVKKKKRPKKKKAGKKATTKKAKRKAPRGIKRRTYNVLKLTGMPFSKLKRSSSPSMSEVFDTCNTILRGQEGGELERSHVIDLVVAEVGKTKQAVTYQIIQLLKDGYLSQYEKRNPAYQ